MGDDSWMSLESIVKSSGCTSSHAYNLLGREREITFAELSDISTTYWKGYLTFIALEEIEFLPAWRTAMMTIKFWTL